MSRFGRLVDFCVTGWRVWFMGLLCGSGWICTYMFAYLNVCFIVLCVVLLLRFARFGFFCSAG